MCARAGVCGHSALTVDGGYVRLFPHLIVDGLLLWHLCNKFTGFVPLDVNECKETAVGGAVLPIKLSNYIGVDAHIDQKLYLCVPVDCYGALLSF